MLLRQLFDHFIDCPTSIAKKMALNLRGPAAQLSEVSTITEF